MKKLLFLLGFLISTNLYAQKSIDECQRLARLNYPLIEQFNLIERAKAYDISNVNKGYLPGVVFNAKATYQTEVVEVPIPLPGVKSLSKGQGAVSVEVNQVVWDGGVMRTQKRLIDKSSGVDSVNVEVDLYAIKDRVNSLFFGILLLNENLKLNDLLIDELNRNSENVENYIASGVAMKNDLDVIKVELLNNKQKRQDLLSSKESYVKMLSVMIGESVDSLVVPKVEYADNRMIARPELLAFDAKVEEIETSRYAIMAKNMPKIGVFVQGAYANPGLNFLKEGFSPYAIGGVKLSWNIGSLYTLKSDKSKITVNKNRVEVMRKNFLFHTELSLVGIKSDIEKLQLQIADDDAIVSLRHAIKVTSQSKVANGTLTVSDLVKDILSEQMSLQNRAIHKMMLLKTIYDYKFITNN